MNCKKFVAIVSFSFALHCSSNNVVRALPFLPAIPKGDIAIQLNPVATGLGAPDYGTSPPGDTVAPVCR